LFVGSTTATIVRHQQVHQSVRSTTNNTISTTVRHILLVLHPRQVSSAKIRQRRLHRRPPRLRRHRCSILLRLWLCRDIARAIARCHRLGHRHCQS
jgi:hypothetical protein